MRKNTEERLIKNQYNAVVQQNKQLQNELFTKNKIIIELVNLILMQGVDNEQNK